MNFIQRALHERMPLIAGLLAAILVIMLILFFLQWYLISELFSFAADLMEDQLVQQAPDGVDSSEITATFGHVRQALKSMPLSYLRGKIRLKKVKAAADYSLKANADQYWTAEEVNTLLQMMNAAVGFRREEK
ncbi:MAG: hypothetical protein O7E52_23035 [Candidatus Poribacteria bacterium]|nr:hypothetical protein [Candidatus Poribacteria bacterium]